LNTFTTPNTSVNNLQKKVEKTILVEASALHFIFDLSA
jgi:hypothetical protein